MDLAAFNYHLPEELIAQQPLAERAASRMLVVYRNENRWEDRLFCELPAFLHAGDCLVLNDSRVFPARLFGHRAGVHAHAVGKNNPKLREHLSGRVEVFLLRAVSADGKEWEALVRPGRKMRTGERIRFSDGLEGEIAARGEYGQRRIRFETAGDPFEEFEKIGHVPLPPYIKRADAPADRERYQTVFAREKGSVAAPTAGLHFTPRILDECRARGVSIAYVTLHVGLGTFQPLHTEQVEHGRLHTERYWIGEGDAAAVNAARRVVAVGTTSVRTLESAMVRKVPDLPGGPRVEACHGDTDIFIYPGFQFRAVGAMLTNFHLPRTSLLLLVCAYAGRELALAAYRHAVQEKYRFYSYGDCMLIL
ncbi:MAG: tRNA preQ1(34) S-adenosylmethionine ribosyltransferase-isomerase QueA [Bryobacteraceae bacterium]